MNNYFQELTDLLKQEQETDRASYQQLVANTSPVQRRDIGISWYPVAIRSEEMGKGDYITIELERTTHQHLQHQFRSGMPAAFFSNHNAKEHSIAGTISFVGGNKLKLALRVDELPDWAQDGKLGVDLLFDEVSYEEMFAALATADRYIEDKEKGELTSVLINESKPAFDADAAYQHADLNNVQQLAVQKMLAAKQLAIVHGPPGTGKTTTIVAGIKQLLQKQEGQILVTAPSNAAVDLLTQKLAEAGVRVVRIGNLARIDSKMLEHTLDHQMNNATMNKEVKRLKMQARTYMDMAHKYKRHFGKAEREQRKALFAEARKVMKEVEQTEQYIVDSILSQAQVVTATLVGSNNFQVRNRRYAVVVIDEAGQALEPACWIAALKAPKLVMAGDHFQLPPTVKSGNDVNAGLYQTLFSKNIQNHPEAVVMLEMQYRMHEQIMGYSSMHFYKNQLTAHPSVAQHLLFSQDKALSFIDTAGCGYDEQQEGTSIANPEEAAFLFRHLTGLVQSISEQGLPSFPTIGVIAPYKEQVLLMQQQLTESESLKPFQQHITVNTIDSFQGQERDIMYIGLVRSNTDNNIGFLSDIRRMNVAMTRARKKMVVVGDSATLSIHPFYAGFIAYAEKEDAWISAWEFA